MDESNAKIEQLKAQLNELTKQNRLLTVKNSKLTEQLAAALDRTGLYIWEQHVPTGKLSIINQTFGTMCGYHPNEMESTVLSWKKNLHPDDRERVVNAFEDHLAGKSPYYHVTHKMVHKNGHDVWVSDRGRVVEYDKSGKPLRMMGTHIDITQEKLYELELSRHANLDPLTNLSNRKALQNHFEQYTLSDDSQGGSLLFIDLDDFKAINDLYGHHVGDEFLLEISKRLNNEASNGDIAARVGGDEFVILSKRANKKDVEALAKSLLQSLIQPIIYENAELIVSVSIGICIFKPSDEDFYKLYKKADKAMYSIKRKSKNNYAFWQ